MWNEASLHGAKWKGPTLIKTMSEWVQLFIKKNATNIGKKYVKIHVLSSSLHRSCQSVSVEANKVVATVTLQATAEVMKDGVTCEVSNEHGTDSKTLAVAIKRGQCHERRATTMGLYLPSSLSFMFFFAAVFWCLDVIERCVFVRNLKNVVWCSRLCWKRVKLFLPNLFMEVWFQSSIDRRTRAAAPALKIKLSLVIT